MVITESYTAPPPQGEPGARWNMDALDPERIHGLVNGLIPPEEVRGGRAYGVHVVEDGNEAADIGRYVEWTVFEEFFDNDLERMKKEYSPYDESSTFLLVLDYEKAEPMGAIRIIKPSEAGLKSLGDLVQPDSPWYTPGDTLESRYQEIGDDPDHTVDIATMAVMPDYRSNHSAQGASAALYSTCVRWSLANGFNHWVTIVDKNILDMMQSWGEPFQAFKGADWKSYIDSPASLPVHAELYSGLEKIKDFDQKMSEEQGQSFDVHGLYTRGAGLEGQFVLPSFESDVQ